MIAPVALPLILTLGFSGALFARLDALRRAHYPPARNHVPAHLTLFHHLPGLQAPALVDDLRAEARADAAPAVRLAGLVSLGRGVAIRVESAGLEDLRARLAGRWAPWLVPQDRAPFRPHVTIANKLAPAAARALLEALRHDFRPETATPTGLLLWRLDGVRWTKLVTVGLRPY
jgi:2'-5' RNA ligase